MVNKAKFFDARILKEGSQLDPKIVSMLVDYGEKMEQTLDEIRVIMTKAGQKMESETKKGIGRVKEEKTPAKGTPSLSPLASMEQKDKGVVEEKTLQTTR